MTSIVLMPLLLGGCASVPTREPVTRNIPGPPSYLRPAAVPPATKGASPFVVAEKRKHVIVHQNRVIVNTRSAWTKMKNTYSKSFLKRSAFGR